MQHFSLQLQSRTALVIRDSFSDHRIRLERLAELTGGCVEETSPPPHVILLPEDQLPPAVCRIQKWVNADMYFLPEKMTFFMVPDPEKWGTDEFLVHLWQMSLEAAVVSAAFRGEDLLLIHGALLDTACGGILLCGQSGMGKSTSSRRWREAGGTVFADDMILLEFAENTITAHPMPTWSRCRISLDGEHFPFDRTIPLRRVIALARGTEREELKSVSETEYFMNIYSACIFFYSALLKPFAGEWQARLLQQVRSKADQLAKLTPPIAFFARLDGNIKETFRDVIPE